MRLSNYLSFIAAALLFATTTGISVESVATTFAVLGALAALGE